MTEGEQRNDGIETALVCTECGRDASIALVEDGGMKTAHCHEHAPEHLRPEIVRAMSSLRDKAEWMKARGTRSFSRRRALYL